MAQALDHYRQLEDLYREMLAAARREEWEEVGRLGERAAAVTAELQAAGDATTAKEGRETKAAAIQRVLALVGELQALAGPAREARLRALTENKVRAKVSNAYGQ